MDMLIRTPLVFADLRNLVIRNPLVFGQNYLRKHNLCQKSSRLRREIIYENTTFAKILENKGVLTRMDPRRAGRGVPVEVGACGQGTHGTHLL